jgi:hypothetical protein
MRQQSTAGSDSNSYFKILLPINLILIQRQVMEKPVLDVSDSQVSGKQ